MKKAILFSLLLIVTISCGRKYCQDKYPCIEKDSTSFIQTANIDTIYIPMQSDTTFIQVPADCKDQNVIYKDGKVEYRIIIKDKILNVYRINEKDSLRIIYAYKNTEEYKKLTEVKYVDKIIYKIPKWCYYVFGLVFIWFGWTYRKTWLNWLKILLKI